VSEFCNYMSDQVSEFCNYMSDQVSEFCNYMSDQVSYCAREYESVWRIKEWW
jgi:hypothetical protein